MANVAIVTDSSCCLPPSMLKEYQISVAPTYVVINGKAFRDGLDISTAEFWQHFRTSKELPTTSAASPGDFLKIFASFGQNIDSILCVTLSQRLSATYTAALQAKEMLSAEKPGLKIDIFDSKTSVGALGFIAIEAARAAMAHKSLAEVKDVAQRIGTKAKYFIVLESPKYIVRIGRAPNTPPPPPEQLKFCPIMGVVKNEGLVDMLGREPDMKTAVERASSMIADYANNGPLHVMLHYSESVQEIKWLEEIIKDRYNCAEVYVSQFSPVVVTALGPSVGIAFYT